MGSILKDRKQMRHLALMAIALIGTTGPLVAQKSATTLSPLQKISQSFSNDKLGRTTMPKGAKLMQNDANNPECSPQKLADCYVRDANGVELYFSPYDGLNSKEISIDDTYSGAVRALGIGKARSQKDVMAAANRFVPNLSFDCSAAYKSDYTSCVAHIPKKMGTKAAPKEQDPATVKLVFYRYDDRIKSVLVRRSDFID
jgi:hypothetical protein